MYILGRELFLGFLNLYHVNSRIILAPREPRGNLAMHQLSCFVLSNAPPPGSMNLWIVTRIIMLKSMMENNAGGMCFLGFG